MAAELRAGLLGDDACKKLDYVFEDTEIIYPTVEPIPLPELRYELSVEELIERVSEVDTLLDRIEEKPKKKRSRNEGEVKKVDYGPMVKRWCVTYNNPGLTGKAMIDLLEGSEVVCGYVFQLEEGKNGTSHFQMYIELNARKRLSFIKELLNNNTIHGEQCEKHIAQRKEKFNGTDKKIPKRILS